MGRKLLHILFLLNLVFATLADFTADCPEECNCMWHIGNKAADCSNAQLQDIPKTLSTEIQNLDLSGNDLYEITRHAFNGASLINLKKLSLRKCKLITIQESGFSGLSIMIALDLSKNDLKVLKSDTFRETVEIRWILLNDNKLEKLEAGLFNNLPFLQKVDLSNNRIATLEVKTFMNVPKLNILRLDGNKLEHLKIDTLSELTSLSNLDVHDNPWRCDCYLRPFMNWVVSEKLYTSPISCAGPPKVLGKLWKELDSNDFACGPSIVYPSTGTTLRTSDSNVTLSCQVTGNPLPDVNWVLNAQIIDESYRYQGEIKYIIEQSSSTNCKWVNLTIENAGSIDNGEYLCVAENPGGVEERSLTLVITQTHHLPSTDLQVGCDQSLILLSKKIEMSSKTLESAVREVTKTVLDLKEQVLSLQKHVIDQNIIIQKLIEDSEITKATQNSSTEEGRQPTSSKISTQRPIREDRARAALAITAASRSANFGKPLSTSRSAPPTPRTSTAPLLLEVKQATEGIARAMNTAVKGDNESSFIEVTSRRTRRSIENY